MTSNNDPRPKAPASEAKRTVQITNSHIDDIVQRFMDQCKLEVKRPVDLGNQAKEFDSRKNVW